MVSLIKNIFNQNSQLSKIGTKKEYQKYLKSIFSNSKIKKVVYHHSNKKLEKFQDNFNKGYASKHGVSSKSIFFLKKPAKKEFLSKRKYLNYCKINLRNPLIYENKFNRGTKEAKNHSGIKERIDYAIKNKKDGVIFNRIWDNKHWCSVFTVFSSKQTWILGSKKDIKNFQKYSLNKF